MARLADLLKYKEEITIVHPKTQKPLQTVWIKVLGDEDIKESYRYARIASAAMRKLLKDPTSAEYKDEILTAEEQDEDDLKQLILASRENDFLRESVAAVAREELPKMEEVAVEPDAPSLEEQETLDEATDKIEQEYMKKIDDYVATKKTELQQQIDNMTHDELVETAKVELQKIRALQRFSDELNEQRGFRATFKDKECKKREFADVEEFRNAHSAIKQQIWDAYDKLELSPEDLKN